MFFSDDVMVFFSVLDGDVGMIKRVVCLILLFGIFRVDVFMILECFDKIIFFVFIRKFFSWRVLFFLILLNWFLLFNVVIIILVKLVMLKFSMLLGILLFLVNLVVWFIFVILIINFLFG